MPWRHLRERSYSSYSFTTSALGEGEWSASRPGRSLPPGKGPLVLIGQGLGGPQSRSGHRLEEKSFRLSQGSNLDRPVVRSVVRHYTDWATLAPVPTTGCEEFNKRYVEIPFEAWSFPISVLVMVLYVLWCIYKVGSVSANNLYSTFSYVRNYSLDTSPTSDHFEVFPSGLRVKLIADPVIVGT
jgi:hypothetical protein